jgi:hypothetical protein
LALAFWRFGYEAPGASRNSRSSERRYPGRAPPLECRPSHANLPLRSKHAGPGTHAGKLRSLPQQSCHRTAYLRGSGVAQVAPSRLDGPAQAGRRAYVGHAKQGAVARRTLTQMEARRGICTQPERRRRPRTLLGTPAILAPRPGCLREQMRGAWRKFGGGRKGDGAGGAMEAPTARGGAGWKGFPDGRSECSDEPLGGRSKS